MQRVDFLLSDSACYWFCAEVIDNILVMAAYQHIPPASHCAAHWMAHALKWTAFDRKLLYCDAMYFQNWQPVVCPYNLHPSIWSSVIRNYRAPYIRLWNVTNLINRAPSVDSWISNNRFLENHDSILGNLYGDPKTQIGYRLMKRHDLIIELHISVAFIEIHE